jgi:hypothetical protein
LRTKHHAVDNEGVLVAKELREAYRAGGAFKEIVFGGFAARRKVTTECGDALDVASQLDLLGEEKIASLTVGGALVGEMCFVLCRKFRCGARGGGGGHSVLLDEAPCERSFNPEH